MKTLLEFLNEGIKIEQSKYLDLPNESKDFLEKFSMFAKDYAPVGSKKATILRMPSGLMQVKYDEDSWIKFEYSQSMRSNKFRVSGKLGDIDIQGKWVDPSYPTGKYTAKIGFSNPSSMTSSEIQSFSEELDKLIK